MEAIMKKKTYKEDTNIVHYGRDPDDYHGVVNPPVTHASSIIYRNLADYQASDYRYARSGTPLSDAFEEAMTSLEGGHGAVIAPSGFSAIATTLMAFLQAGDHVLVTDGLYPSVREFCDDVLSRFGVEVTYYDPAIGKGIEKLIRKNTKIIYMESPGSATFDVQDVPAIVSVAKRKNILTVLDNSWASGLLYKPLTQGVNISVTSATKYIGGHSDLMLGVTIADNKKHYTALKAMANKLGVCAGADEIYLALRGLRTLKLRLKQHEINTLKIAKWLQKRPEVQKVYYPALPDHPGHKIWKRDFNGANGLMSILLKPMPSKKLQKFVDALVLFPVANSWGGFESLLQPQTMNRVAVPWKEKGPLLRLHIGLEDPDDLIADFETAFKKL